MLPLLHMGHYLTINTMFRGDMMKDIQNSNVSDDVLGSELFKKFGLV